MPWVQVSDLKQSKNEAANQFGVTGIPDNFLIDPSGIVIARGLRGEALDKKLEEVFKKDEKMTVSVKNNAEIRQPVITLGGPAPEFRYSEWLKGNPVAKLEKGKAYVIEFWSTWCVYCIKAMPYLSELSEKYKGKIEFIGVDVLETVPWGENPATYNKAKIEKFMTEGKGLTMTYNVCRDTYDGFMANNWLKAKSILNDTGNNGIPYTIVVDQNGNVAWIGHPADEAFDGVLEAISNGTYNINDFITECEAKVTKMRKEAQMAEAKRKEAASAPALKPMNDAIAAKNYSLAISEAYKAIEKDASLTRTTYLPRLNSFKELIKTDPEKTYELLKLEKKRISAAKDTVMTFSKDLASFFGIQEGLPKKCYEFVVETLKDEHTAYVMTYRYRKALAMAYYYLGDKEMAIAVYQKVADRTKEMGNDPSEYEKTILMFRK